MADRPQNVLIGAFLTLTCTIFFFWLLVKLVFFLICLRYKCKITFKFKRFHQLTNIHIVKHGPGGEATSRPAEGQEPFVEIFIDRLWFSSCYFNRQIKNRLMICLSGIHMTYSHPLHKKPRSLADLLPANSQTSEENIYMQYLFWIFYLFFKYLGSIHIQNLSVKLFNLFTATAHGSATDGKCKYVGVNIEYFKVELAESNWSNGCHGNENRVLEPRGDEENFSALYELNKNKEVAKLNGCKMLKVSMRNMQLKAFRLKSSVLAQKFETSQHQIIGEMAIKSSDLDILLNKLNTTRKRAISFQGTLIDLIEYVNCIHVYIDETSCQLYKFNSSKSYFNDDLSHLVEFLNSRQAASSSSEGKSLKRAFVSAVSKLQVVEITNMEATCIVTNHHSQRSFSANSSLSSSYKFAKRDKIKLDVLKFFSASKWSDQSVSFGEPRACLGFVLLRNLHYFKMNRYNYSLINQLAVSLIQTHEPKDGGSLYSLLWSCENANLYLHLKLLNDLISSKMFATNEPPLEGGDQSVNGIKSQASQLLGNLFGDGQNNSLKLKFKFKSSYLHLIETVRPSSLTKSGFSPKSFIYVYSIGSKLFDIKYYHIGPGGQRTFDLVLNQSIVFKSTKTGDTLSSASAAKASNSASQLGKLKFTNNLFENNQEWNLNELFDSISCCTSTPPRRSSNQVCNSNHRHYWGQLFNLNSLNLHYESKMSGESCVNLSMSSIHVEYTASFFSIINNLLVSNAPVVKKLVDRLPVSGQITDHPKPQVFINIQSIHVYLFFEKVIFLYLKLDEINYQSIQKASKTFQKSSCSNNGFCLLINEINFLQLKIDECYLQNNDVALAQAKASTFINSDSRIASYNPAEYLNYFIIYDFLESSSSDYNLIWLVKSFNLNSHQVNEGDETWYFTIQDIMFTWSFQIHFIVLDTLLAPFSRLMDSAKLNLPESLFKSRGC